MTTRLFVVLAFLFVSFNSPLLSQTTAQRQQQQQRYQQQQRQQQLYQRQRQLQARQQRLQQLQRRQQQMLRQQQQILNSRQKAAQAQRNANNRTNALNRQRVIRRQAALKLQQQNAADKQIAADRIGRSRAFASSRVGTVSSVKTVIPPARSPQIIQAKAALRTNQLNTLRASLQTKLQARGSGGNITPAFSGGVSASKGNKSANNKSADYAYHYTFNQSVESIKKEGLRPGSFLTPNGKLSPLQAQLDLALSPTGSRNATLRIDLEGLRRAGYKIPEIKQVERSYQMPGGGSEMKFDYAIPPQFIQVVEK